MDYRQAEKMSELLERLALAQEGVLRALENMTVVQAGSWMPGTRLKYDAASETWTVVSFGAAVQVTQEML